MKTLIIDCSCGLKISLINNGKEQSFIDETLTKQSSSLLEHIDKLLNKENLSMNDINVIAVNVGPGSFTGIRVAIATAKGLAIGCNAKVITFNSFESVQANITERNFGIIAEGFGNNYYYYFKKFGKVFQGCATADKLSVLAKDISVYSVSDKVCNKIVEFTVNKISYNAIKAVSQKIEQGMFVSTNQIVPLYLRASQAEIERLKNGN